MEYDTLFSPLDVGPVELRNRVMSSGHQTTLVEDNLPTEDFFAYHLARARGGAGLVVLEAHKARAGDTPSGHVLDAGNDAIVDAYAPFVDRMHEEGCRVFAQLLEGGREQHRSGYAPPAVAPSETPTERYHVVPRALDTEEVYDLVEDHGEAAANLADAGLDGIEVGGSHGYLLSQFWSPHVNDRDDEFGGDLEARCRFPAAVVDEVRDRVDDDVAVGMRISLGERHERGMSLSETLDVVAHLEDVCDLDYWSFVVGSSSTYRSSNFIVPPVTAGPDIVTDPVEAVADLVDGRVIATSRIDSPERAERTVSEGPIDVVGMTRAMIADPELVRKTRDGDREDVTPCVACNQGCIGRYHEGLPIRCTINPVTGRERDFADVAPASDPESVLVVGGGPAGMVAAATAGDRGHEVTLLERDADLGGQVRAYADLDHRGRFEDWLAVLTRRLEDADVDVRTGYEAGPADLDRFDPDAVVLATGATGRLPDVPVDDEATVLTAREALDAPDRLGDRVVVSDWDGSQAALDVAEALGPARDVEVVTEAYTAGEAVQQYVQNSLLADLDSAGCTFTPRHRVAAVDDSSVTLANVLTEERTVREDVDAVVFAHRGKRTRDGFEAADADGVTVHRVGDRWAPRSLDEAVSEGFETAVDL